MAMRIQEIRLNARERGRMTRIAKRIYNRLVVEDAEINSQTDVIQNTIGAVVQFMFVGGIGAVTYYFLPPLLEYGAAAAGFSAEAAPVIAIVRQYSLYAGVLIAFLIFILAQKAISRISFEFSGILSASAAKAFNNRSHKKLLKMLDVVEQWMRTQPRKVCDAHEFLYSKPASELLPQKLTKALEKTKSASGNDALVIRGFAEKRYWPLYLSSIHNKETTIDVSRRQRNYWLEARGLRNAIRMNLAFDILGAELRDEIPGGEKWRREYYTAHPRQHTALVDTRDLHLRFKTGAPYYRWPRPGQDSSEKETALYRAIMALENPMRAPIDLISAHDVIERLDEAVGVLFPELKGDAEPRKEGRRNKVDEALTLLQRNDIHMYGKRSPQTMRPSADAGIDSEPILRNLNQGKTDQNGDDMAPRWQLRWDPNVIDWSKTVDPDGALFRALAILVQAVDLASDHSARVRLGRGDLLLIDNLTCLVCRREWMDESVTGDLGFFAGLSAWLKKLICLPDRWWLRGFYGFRRTRPTKTAPGS